MKHIGDKLRRVRKDKALRMIDVQDATGISTATLTAIETGKNINFKLQTLIKLTDLYNKNVVITLEATNEQDKESI
ncbi:helix-turn-helix transcriptional regulator [Candidatus Pacearchaeota archaeon]|nr:helix-turn-helix transcriptional regulator [Candidatus Pacearchaeota archaeon]